MKEIKVRIKLPSKQELNKKYKMGMTFEELMDNINKKEELKNKLNESIKHMKG